METRSRRRSSLQRFGRGLPIELVTEVLKRLPVKAIVRFKCVCKAWSSLVSSIHFVSLHLSHVQSKEYDPPILTYKSTDANTQCTLRSSHAFRKLAGRDYRIQIPRHLDNLKKFRLHRSCDGGLVLLISNRFELISNRFEISWWRLILWNPLLGKTHTLSPPPIGNYRYAAFGHGFNSLSNEYKVVMIISEPHTSVHIYDFSVRTWRITTNYNSESITGKVWSEGFLMEGSIHWLSRGSNFFCSDSTSNDDLSLRMLSFDVNSEVFNCVMLPSEFGACVPQLNYPVMYRKKLGLLNVTSTSLCSLWVMEKDKTSVPWIKLYQVDLSMKLQYGCHNTFINVLYFKQNGQVMFSTTRAVKCYDFENQKMKDAIETLPNDCMNRPYSVLYRESLLLL